MRVCMYMYIRVQYTYGLSTSYVWLMIICAYCPPGDGSLASKTVVCTLHYDETGGGRGFFLLSLS